MLPLLLMLTESPTSHPRNLGIAAAAAPCSLPLLATAAAAAAAASSHYRRCCCWEPGAVLPAASSLSLQRSLRLSPLLFGSVAAMVVPLPSLLASLLVPTGSVLRFPRTISLLVLDTQAEDVYFNQYTLTTLRSSKQLRCRSLPATYSATTTVSVGGLYWWPLKAG